MDTAEAKQAIIDATDGKGDQTLDEMADNLIKRVGMFVGECVGGDTFCGFSIEEIRGENGLVHELRLVACDLVSGEPVRRAAR
jgi:hypothetical protein